MGKSDMTKVMAFIVLFFTANVMASNCEDLFNNHYFENIVSVCQDEAEDISMTNQGEITRISNGSVESQYILGLIFEKGYGVE